MLKTDHLLCLALLAAAAVVPAQSSAPAASAASSTPQPRPSPCSAPIYGHFDFWIGRWDVMGANGKFAGANRITSVDGGCALHENWSSGAGGYTGQSLNSVGPDGRWHQTWIDRSGLRLELTGGLVGESMVLEGETPASEPKQPAVLNRITWTPQSANLVRQHWETSTDQGKSWATAFDGMYHRIPDATPPAPSFLTTLQGGWIGQGQLMRRDSHVELRVESMLGQPLFSLNWRNVVLSEPLSAFDGSAVYEDRGNGNFSATWWDSQGAKHPIKAASTATSMTSEWGENGRTVYTLLASGDLEVVDSMKRADGSWSEFGRATLKRK